VAELNPVVLDWCRGPLAPLTLSAASDPRVAVEIADVAKVIARSAREEEKFDAIVLDLYRGPHDRSDKKLDPLYGQTAIERARAALTPGGVFAVWGENYDLPFATRLEGAGFAVQTDRPGRGGLRHVVYVARKLSQQASNRQVRGRR